MGNDLWEGIIKTVANVAPILGNAIAPGFGGVAGALVADMLGVDNEPNAITAALASASPETMLRLKELQLANKQRLAAIGLELEKALLVDRADARTMQKVALQGDDIVAKLFVYYFGAFIVTVSFIYIGAITFIAIPKDNIRFVDTVLGFMLGTLVATVVQFFFGSSDGSKKKTQIMATKDFIVDKIKDKVQK